MFDNVPSRHPAYRRITGFLYHVARAENTSAADMPALLRVCTAFDRLAKQHPITLN